MTRLAVTVQQAQQSLDLAFKDESGRVVGSVKLAREALDTFISQLVAARELLKPGASSEMGKVKDGAVHLPPPVEYYSMTAGVDRKSGLPVLGFKVGPDLWLSFRIEAEGVPGLARLLAAEASKAPT